jgi:hypothetical protein
LFDQDQGKPEVSMSFARAVVDARGVLLMVSVVGGCVAVGAAELAAQGRPLAPNPPTGLTVSPFFEGWFANPDGTYMISLGYFNRNLGEAIYIPRGPNNFIEPAELDGFQPEHFPSRRVRGVFTVTVPADYPDWDRPLVWTLINRGDTLSVPGPVGVSSYELGYRPMAMGSLPPVVRFEPGGPSGRGPMGIINPATLTASVGTSLTLRLWATDESMREGGSTVNVNLNWFTHQGPAAAEFSEEQDPDAELGGEATAVVTFSEPGEYVLRVAADIFSAPDSSSGNQCCWTNGYFRVNVSP